jgi:hypothetical protein
MAHHYEALPWNHGRDEGVEFFGNARRIARPLSFGAPAQAGPIVNDHARSIRERGSEPSPALRHQSQARFEPEHRAGILSKDMDVVTRARFACLHQLTWGAQNRLIQCIPFLEIRSPNSNTGRMREHSQSLSRLLMLAGSLFITGCSHLPTPGRHLAREGDEIVAAGQFFHIGAPVVLWLDPGGYDAYRVERRFAPLAKADWADSTRENPGLTSPNRYGMRRSALSSWEAEQMRGGGWDLLTLQRTIDQFVIHFDAAGTSRQCFNILQDHRDLSVHFMLDLDGTIYQTLDLKERAWHASQANTRSIGIEIANIGAYPLSQRSVLDRWYKKDTNGSVRIVIPQSHQPSGIRSEDFVARPARETPVTGKIQNQELIQYDFTPQQYDALIKLTAALCKIFPKLECDYPHDAQGRLIRVKIPEGELDSYHGVLGHYHVQKNKVDPGPAFQWDKVIDGAKELLDQ